MRFCHDHANRYRAGSGRSLHTAQTTSRADQPHAGGRGTRCAHHARPPSRRSSPDLEAALSPLTVLDDEALWQASRRGLPAGVSDALEELHLKQQREGLTEPERQALADLVRQYERNLLVRARAAALLQE